MQKEAERGRMGGGLERKKKEENMYSLPSPHIRDTLEVTEMERSNPPRSDFKGRRFWRENKDNR